MGNNQKEVKYLDDEYIVKADMYVVHDFMGKEMGSIALFLYDKEDMEPVLDITKGFGEFIGQPCVTFLNGNTYSFDLEDFMKETGLGVRAPFANKHSGFCEYPPYIINPYFLEDCYEKDVLKEYFGYYDYGNEHILDDKEYEQMLKNLKTAYDKYCEKGNYKNNYKPETKKEVER